MSVLRCRTKHLRGLEISGVKSRNSPSLRTAREAELLMRRVVDELVVAGLVL